MMDQINVQRWANSLRQFHEIHCQPSIFTHVYVDTHKPLRNTSTLRKTMDHESSKDNHQHSLILDFSSSGKEDSCHTLTKSQFYKFDMTSTNEDSHIVSLSDHPDTDNLSDAGTYRIEDDDDEIQDTSYASSTFKRCLNQTINRPIIDLNFAITKESNASSPNQNKPSDELIEQSSSRLQPHAITTTQSSIKPPEYFVISPILPTKSLPNRNIRRPQIGTWRKEKSSATKDTNGNIWIDRSVSPSNQNSSERCAFYFRKSPPSTEQTNQSCSFDSSQRDSTLSPTTSTHCSSRCELIHPSKPTSTKIHLNKSFLLRQKNSHPLSSTSSSNQHEKSLTFKTSSQPNSKPISGPISSTSCPAQSTRHVNRTVELRRAHAQIKIEKLSTPRAKKLHKINHPGDIMSKSWQSSDSQSSQQDPKMNALRRDRDLFLTRTILSPSHHLSSVTNPIPYIETPTEDPKTIISNVTDEEKYKHMFERWDMLRDNGQKLALKLMRLTSGILERLKFNESAINNDVSIRELEQLVRKLETADRALSSIGSSLVDSTCTERIV